MPYTGILSAFYGSYCIWFLPPPNERKIYDPTLCIYPIGTICCRHDDTP
jgi:hypothetical protein